MAHFVEKKDRHVIPNWRSFENTAQIGELNGSHDIRIEPHFKPDLSDLLFDWDHAKSIGVAADILGVAVSFGDHSNERLQDIAKYVLEHEQSTPALIDAANIVSKERDQELDYKFELGNIRSFRLRELEDLYVKIQQYKKVLIRNPHNAIAWVELSRLYAINGQDKQAERAMKNAVQLAPENRFVLRNMARFFTHNGQLDFAHDIIRNSQIVKHDPWVMATEIALADLRGRGSRLIKKGMMLIESNKFHPFNTCELASSIATLEFSNSSSKKGRKLIQKSLIMPNDNALAQAEWVSQEQGGDPIDPSKFKVVNSFEALARDAAEHANWKKAMEYSRDWFLDLPFSKGAVLFGNEVASSKLKDHKLAADVAKIGLVSHPRDPLLLNNIAYSLSLIGEVEEAEKYLNKLKPDDLDTIDNMICVTATQGLIAFRKGLHEFGRQLYLYSMELAKEANKTLLNNVAYANYVREEILAGSDDLVELMNKLAQVKKASTSQGLNDLITDVTNLYEKNSK